MSKRDSAAKAAAAASSSSSPSTTTAAPANGTRSRTRKEGRSSSDSCDVRWGLDSVGGPDGVHSRSSDDGVFRDGDCGSSLTPEEIVSLMGEVIAEVNSVLHLRATATRLLLNHYRWDKMLLFEKFFDADSDPKKLFREVEIPPANASNDAPGGGAPNPASRDSQKTFECQICLCETGHESMTSHVCGHQFCGSCWDTYLTTKVMDEGCHMITCAASSCGALIEDHIVINLLSDPKAKARYRKRITDSFVECNRLLRWCPRPDCTYAIKVNSTDVRAVRCNCGNIFCFGCGLEFHEPVNCTMLRAWLKKCNDDSETSNWLAANTKECPKCFVPIQKDGGCNHVLCRNQNCRMDFCWVCLGPWEPHGSAWYNCNRFNEEESKKARDAQEKSRATLSRYLFYFNRYYNHMQSLKFERKLPEKISSWAADPPQGAQTGFSRVELDFLPKAVEALLQCRQTLMFTYVFAFYLRANNQSRIFEDNQRDLERATEHLSELLERDAAFSLKGQSTPISTTANNSSSSGGGGSSSGNPIDPGRNGAPQRFTGALTPTPAETAEKEKASLNDLRIKVVDKHRYCERRRRALLAHVREGDEKDWWEFANDPQMPQMQLQPQQKPPQPQPQQQPQPQPQNS